MLCYPFELCSYVAGVFDVIKYVKQLLFFFKLSPQFKWEEKEENEEEEVEMRKRRKMGRRRSEKLKMRMRSKRKRGGEVRGGEGGK